jgi:kynurenine 3-monooxygenase
MDLAEQHGVEILFEHRLQKMDWKSDAMDFDVTGRSTAKDFKADIVFAADGAYSACRLNHMLQHDRFEYAQSYIDFGYKELHIPAGENHEFLLEKNALHIWPRGNYMLIALPNLDATFTATLFFPFEGDPSFASITTGKKAREFFDATFTDASKLMPTLEQDFMNNPTSSLVTVKCFPWVRNDNFAMIGDAAHAIVPFFGQGMNCGFEDCSVLNQLMDEYGDNWTRILDEFQRVRKPDTDAIADLALNNFIEMRDRVGDPKFLLQKKIEGRLHEKFPNKWIPAYSQVTFSPHIRYRDALKNGNRQEEIMREVMKRPDIENTWDDDALHSSIIQKLESKKISVV